MIKDKNIDPAANFPGEIISFSLTGAVSATNVPIQQWCAPWAGKVVGVSYSVVSATSATGTIDIVRGTAPTATTGTSIFAAAYTNATTGQTCANLTANIQATTATFAAGEYLQLKISNAAPTTLAVHVIVRPLLAKEIFGY